MVETLPEELLMWVAIMGDDLVKPVLSARQRWRRAFVNVAKLSVVPVLGAYVLLSPQVAWSYLYRHAVFHPGLPPGDDSNNLAVIRKSIGATQEDIMIPVADGQKVSMRFFGIKDSKYCILISHGNGGDITYRTYLAGVLLRTGCSVLLYDYEGYGKSTGNPSIEGVINDGLAAFDYLTREKKYSPDHIILYGESLGTAVTTCVARLREPKAVIIQSGFTSLVRAGKNTIGILNIYPDFVFPGLQFDNLTYVQGKHHPPILIMHGNRDNVLPYQFASEMKRCASGDVELVTIDGATHDVFSTGEKPVAEALTRFIKKVTAT